MPTWPGTLPQKPLSGSWSRVPQINNVAFEPAVGPPIVRRRGSVRTHMVRGRFGMSQAQIVTFETFYETDLKDGSLSFDWVDPETGVTASWRFKGYTISDAGKDERFVDFELTRLPS